MIISEREKRRSGKQFVLTVMFWMASGNMRKMCLELITMATEQG